MFESIHTNLATRVWSQESWIRSISEISSCFWGRDHIEIRHRVKKTSTINLFGFETLKLKIRRLKLWKPTALDATRGLPLRRLALAEEVAVAVVVVVVVVVVAVVVVVVSP